MIEALVRGDEFAYHYLYKHYYKDLCLVARSYTETMDEAEEIVQNLIFTIWQKKDSLAAIKNLRAYMVKSVRNNCISYIKTLQFRNSRKNEILQKLKEIELKNVNEFIYEDFESDLQRAIHTLPEQCRKVFVLSRFEQLKNMEIAEKLKISTKTVESHITRAIKKLRESMKNYMNFWFIGFLIIKNLLNNGG